MTDVVLPADQFTMRAYSSREPEDPEFAVESLLPFLGFGQVECDLNHYILPMQTSVQQYVCPALEAAEAKWTPWNTTLGDNFRLHLMACDRELFVSMRPFASRHHFVINLGGGHPTRRILTYVEVLCLPLTETVEVLGRMDNTLRKLRDDVHVLQTELPVAPNFRPGAGEPGSQLRGIGPADWIRPRVYFGFIFFWGGGVFFLLFSFFSRLVVTRSA